MSVCTFIASNAPLPEAAPQANYFLSTFRDFQLYTDKKHALWLLWDYTDGGAGEIIKYIKNALEHDPAIEVWHVFLGDFYGYEESPVIHRCTVPFSDITIDDIKEIDSAKIFNMPDKIYPHRPSFYCLTVTR